jgi:hypothetical protein
MNKIKLIIIGVAALLATVSQAQNTPPSPVTPPPDNTEVKHAVVEFAQLTSSNRDLTIAAYPMYAPDIVVNGKKDNFGVGLALLTPVSAINALQDNTVAKHSFVGLRFDYLAHQAFASTVGVGIKGDVQLWGHNFTGFGTAGANIPFGGFGVKNGEIGAMAGGGGYTDLYRFAHGALGIQISAEKWTQFPGVVFLGGPVLNIKF